MVKIGRININDIVDPVLKDGINRCLFVPTEEIKLEVSDLVLKIEYLLDHPKLRLKNPKIYDLTLDKLKCRYLEEVGEEYII